jgi:D-apionolactonase
VRFGDLSGRLGPGPQLADIQVSGRIMLDAVALTLRADDWSTPPLELVTAKVVQHTDRTRVDSTWRGVAGWRDVTAHFTLEGGPGADLVATATISATDRHPVRRAGLCVLHPLELLGARFLLATTETDWECEFAEPVSPFPPYPDFVGLTLPVGQHGRLQLDFGDSVMEIEDHRNWSDAGWKSYTPPLDADPPLPLGPSLQHGQRLRLTARPDTTAPAPPAPRVVVGPLDGRHLPRIGSSAAAGPVGPDPTHVEHAKLSSALDFLHVELVDGPQAAPRLAAARRQAQAIGRPLRLTLATTVDELRTWLGLLAEEPELIEAICLIDWPGLCSAPELIKSARALLDLNGLDVQLGGGTRGYLAELLRCDDSFAGVDYLQLSVSGQVHHVDPERVMDTTRAHPFVVPSAKRRAPGVPVAVGPITMEQRMNMHRDPMSYAPYAGPWPTSELARAPFGAAWCLATVAGLRDAAALTLFDLTDGAGLVDGGTVTPAAEVVTELATRSGTPTRSCMVSTPRQVAALALAADNGTELYLANRQPEPVEVTVELDGLTKAVNLAPYAVVSLNRDGAIHAMTAPGRRAPAGPRPS